MRITAAALGLLLASLLASTTLAGCTDAGKCTRGEPGCACKTDGTCNSGSTCNTDKKCIERTGPPPEEDAGEPPPPIDIECVDDDFESACQAFCDVYCAVQARLCAESRCSPGECGPEDCMTGCGGEDPNCLKTGCEVLKETQCKDYGAPETDGGVFVSFCSGEDPVCAPDPEYGCSDVCGDNEFQTGGDFANNDLCQDGELGSTGTKRCARGTDCSDCGARTCAADREPCTKNGDCCGFPNDSFCIDQLGGCAAICSDDRPCEHGETCTPLAGSEDSVCVP